MEMAASRLRPHFSAGAFVLRSAWPLTGSRSECGRGAVRWFLPRSLHAEAQERANSQDNQTADQCGNEIPPSQVRIHDVGRIAALVHQADDCADSALA